MKLLATYKHGSKQNYACQVVLCGFLLPNVSHIVLINPTPSKISGPRQIQVLNGVSVKKA